MFGIKGLRANPAPKFSRNFKNTKGLRQKSYRQTPRLPIQCKGMRRKVLSGNGLGKNNNRFVKRISFLFVPPNIMDLPHMPIVSQKYHTNKSSDYS